MYAGWPTSFLNYYYLRHGESVFKNRLYASVLRIISFSYKKKVL